MVAAADQGTLHEAAEKRKSPASNGDALPAAWIPQIGRGRPLAATHAAATWLASIERGAFPCPIAIPIQSSSGLLKRRHDRGCDSDFFPVFLFFV